MPKTRHARRTKTIATLGSASSDPATIQALFEAGIDVFRLNASHCKHADHAAQYATLREMERRANYPVAVLIDLRGPKLRVGTFVDGKAELHEGQQFRLDLDSASGDAARVATPHPELFAALVPGTEVLLDDRRVHLRLVRCEPDHAETMVVSGGVLSNRKSINLPRSTLSTKDRQDLACALDFGMDRIGLSFVQRPKEVVFFLLDPSYHRFTSCGEHFQFPPALGTS